MPPEVIMVQERLAPASIQLNKPAAGGHRGAGAIGTCFDPAE